jgi:PIN domain nuclease of toxin-antitoxin system
MSEDFDVMPERELDEAGKLRLRETPSVYVPTRMAHYTMVGLPIELAHVLAAASSSSRSV